MQTAGHDLVSFASKVTRGGIAQTSIRCAGRLELTGEANCPEQRPPETLSLGLWFPFERILVTTIVVRWRKSSAESLSRQEPFSPTRTW